MSTLETIVVIAGIVAIILIIGFAGVVIYGIYLADHGE